MSVFRFGAARSPPRRPIVQGSEQSPFCTSPIQLQEVTLDPNMNTTIPFPGRSPGKTSPLRGHALKEYEEQLAHLKKENFNLKLRIYFLEERMGRMNADDKEDVIKKNVELRVEAESLRKDVSDKQELLCHASKAVELLEEQHRNKLKQIQSEREAEKGMLESRIQELEKEIQASEAKSLACTIDHTQTVDQLENKIKELELQVNQLGTSAHDESERANQLDIDLQEVQQEKESLNNQCQGLEADLKKRGDQLKNLLQELDQKGQDLTNGNNKIRSLEEALSAKESDFQIKVQELKECTSVIAEKQSQLEEQSKVLAEIQITLNEAKHQIEELHSSVMAKNEAIEALENRLEKAKAASNKMETKLEASLQEVNRLKEEVETLKSQRRRYKSTREHIEEMRIQSLLQKSNENVSPLHGRSSEEEVRRHLANELIEKEKKLQNLEEKEKTSSRNLLKIRQELSQKDQELQVLKNQAKILNSKINDFEKKSKDKDDKLNEMSARYKKSVETIQAMTKMVKEVEQRKSELAKKDQQITDLTVLCNEMRESSKKSPLDRRQVRTRTRNQGASGVSTTQDEVRNIIEEENEQWTEVEEKNKRIIQLTEERDALSLEMEKQMQMLLTQLTEKEKRLEECEKEVNAIVKELTERKESLSDYKRQLEAAVCDVEKRDGEIMKLEQELNDLRTSLTNQEKVACKEEEQQTDSDTCDSVLKLEIADKKHEIERLNAELRKRTTNLQELVNKELWDKNREIEKLQDRLNIACERKEVEIATLRQQIETRDFQLKVMQDRVNQLLSQTTCTSPVVIKEVQPITLNNHLHIQQPDSSVPSFEEQVSCLRQQLNSSEEQKKYLYQRLEELEAQLHVAVSEDKVFAKSCSECTKLKEEAEHAMAIHKETAEVCTMLIQRLEELAKFLSSLLKRREFLGALGQKRWKFLSQVVENSMELSRSITVSFIDSQETSLQMNSLSGILTSASELNLSLFKLQGEDETETEINFNESLASDQGLCELDSKTGTTHEQFQLIQELRSQVDALREQIKEKDAEISKARVEQSGRVDVNDNPNSGINFAGNHESKPESESSLNSMTFYNSRHSNSANEKWPKPLPLSLRKEDIGLRSIESNVSKYSCPSNRTLAPRLSQSANTTPVKEDSSKCDGNLRIRRSSSANAVSGGTLFSTNQHREYGVASLSESEAWSEPDRNVSMARIGLKEDNLLTGSLNATWCSAGGSGRARRFRDIDISSESSEETTREISRTPSKRSRGDAGDMRKLQSKIRVLEQLNEALRAELNILHQLTSSRGVTKTDNVQPPTRDISVNTSQCKLDKSTSIEQLQEESSVTIPAKLLEQIRYQREKLESSLFHNDFIRRQLEHIFVTLASSQGGDIGDIWQKLKETTEELCTARTKVQELQAKIIELETQLKDSKSKVQQLENTVEQLEATRKTVSLLKEQITDLETKLKEKDNEILEHNCLLLETRNKYEEQLMETKKASEETGRVKEELQRQLHESYVLLADSERRVQEAELQLRHFEMKLQEVEKQKEMMRNETSEKIKKTEMEIYEAEKRRNEAEIQVIEAKKQLQEEESKRFDAEWRAQELEEKIKSREGEYEKYFHEILDRKIKDVELRANLQLHEAEKRLEQKELFYRAEAEKKVQEAERLGSEFEAGLKHQIEEAEKQGRAIRAEGEKKFKELEEKFKLREVELKKRIHDSELDVWEKEAELRRQLDEASMKHSQTALERSRLANEKLHLEQELCRYEAREAELIREKKEAENLLLLSKDKLDLKVLEIGEKKNDLERRVRELEYLNSELEQRLAKMHPIDDYHSHHSTSQISGPYSSSFPYRKTDAISSSSGLDTYSGDGGSLPSSIWSLPPGPGDDVKRKEDSLKGDSSSLGLSALSTLVLQQGFCRQRSEMSDYMSEEPPAEEYETLFTQTCSSRWFSVAGQHSANSGNIVSDSIVSRNINSSPDLGIESDQGRFSSLETATLPPPSVHLDTTDLVRNQTNLGSDVDGSVSALRLLASGDLEDENNRLSKENANLRRDLTRTRKYLEATLAQLTSSNQVKKQLEKAICKQLHKTHHTLRQARRDDFEVEDIKYLTNMVENPK